MAVLLFSVKGDDHWILEAIHAGARGYLRKDADEDDMRRKIQEGRRRERRLRPVVRRSRRLVTRARSFERPARFPAAHRPGVRGVGGNGEGLNNAVIAKELHVSPKQVRNYVSELYTKLGGEPRAARPVQSAGSGQSEPRHGHHGRRARRAAGPGQVDRHADDASPSRDGFPVA